MKLSIVGFTHRGTTRKQNQDRVLVHDQIVLTERFAFDIGFPTHLFVADGVGGARAGDVAADFVLSKIRENLSAGHYQDDIGLTKLFQSVNDELLAFSDSNPDYEGMATTLAGIVFWENHYKFISAGDSQVFLFRNSVLTQLTPEPVFTQSTGNIPITSYFGGIVNSLNLAMSSEFDSACANDVFIVATDGIFKSLTIGQFGKILANSKSLKEKSDFIFYKALQNGSPDNISCIFISVNQ